MRNDMNRRYSFAALVLICLLMSFTVASGNPPERYRLYTKPDPDAAGGIKALVVSPSAEIEAVFACPPDEPRLVYQGLVLGSQKQEFLFEGLPMRKYDIMVVYPKSMYEGFQLERNIDTLTALDKKKLKYTIDKAEPYFNKKIIYRMEGTTGRGNEARLIATYLRDRGSANSARGGSQGGLRRTFKLVMLKDVGPGWQVVRARDLYPIWTTKDKVIATHHYSRALSNIRVTTSIKDLGNIRLTK